MSVVGVAHAETHVTNGYLNANAVWDATGSPYILEDPVTVPAGKSLVIKPGVSVVSGPSIEGYPAFEVQGRLSIEGDHSMPISLGGVGGIQVDGGAADIFNADISLANGSLQRDPQAT